MSPKEIFSQLSLLIVNLYLKYYSFFIFLSYIYICGCGSEFGIRIRMHKATEYGSNMDPDPQH